MLRTRVLAGGAGTGAEPRHRVRGGKPPTRCRGIDARSRRDAAAERALGPVVNVLGPHVRSGRHSDLHASPAYSFSALDARRATGGAGARRLSVARFLDARMRRVLPLRLLDAVPNDETADGTNDGCRHARIPLRQVRPKNAPDGGPEYGAGARVLTVVRLPARSPVAVSLVVMRPWVVVRATGAAAMLVAVPVPVASMPPSVMAVVAVVNPAVASPVTINRAEIVVHSAVAARVDARPTGLRVVGAGGGRRSHEPRSHRKPGEPAGTGAEKFQA